MTMTLYHGAVTTESICKNGSERYGVTAKVKVCFGPDSFVINCKMHGKTAEDAKEKLINLITDDGSVKLEAIQPKENMTKKEAILAMKLGERVTHEYFSHDEYIRMEENHIIDEKGGKLDPLRFWAYRTDTGYDFGWSVKMELEDQLGNEATR